MKGSLHTGTPAYRRTGILCIAMLGGGLHLDVVFAGLSPITFREYNLFTSPPDVLRPLGLHWTSLPQLQPPKTPYTSVGSRVISCGDTVWLSLPPSFARVIVPSQRGTRSSSAPCFSRLPSPIHLHPRTIISLPASQYLSSSTTSPCTNSLHLTASANLLSAPQSKVRHAAGCCAAVGLTPSIETGAPRLHVCTNYWKSFATDSLLCLRRSVLTTALYGLPGYDLHAYHSCI